MERFAIYYAPPVSHPLWDFGCRWLGRDPISGEALASPVVSTLDAKTLRYITAAPRRYGFHGTLKAPFALAPGKTREGLLARLRQFATEHSTFALPTLRLASLGGFLALVPEDPCPPLDALAEACVVELDGFRAPLNPTDLARRRQTSLSLRQEEYLQRWGYPYVLEEFRFHLTLSEWLEAPLREQVQAALLPLLGGLCEKPPRVEDICLFHQRHREADFQLVERFPLVS